jgi:hypothetical protein
VHLGARFCHYVISLKWTISCHFSDMVLLC